MIRAQIDGPGVPPAGARELAPRPLYLQPAGSCRVELDGPALRVRTTNEADRLFPLRRVSRVHTARSVDWAWPAVVACAERGITLIVCDPAGEVVGRLLGIQANRSDLHQRFLDFLCRADWQERYDQWRRAKGEQAALAAARRLSAPEGIARSWQIERWCEAVSAARGLHRERRRVREELCALLIGWIAHWLASVGFDAANEQGQVCRPNLVSDLADCLIWSLEPGLLGWLAARLRHSERKQEPYRAATTGEIVRHFEQGTARLEQNMLELSYSFQAWLIDLD